MNSLLWNLTDVPAPHTWWFHFRVVSTQQEQADQYHGDFQGFHLVFENYDPTFTKTHRMPDGNLYKLKDRIFDGNLLKRHQGTNSVSDDSDSRIFAIILDQSVLKNGSIPTLTTTKLSAITRLTRLSVTLMSSQVIHTQESCLVLCSSSSIFLR